jgi:hypothetical protein
MQRQCSVLLVLLWSREIHYCVDRYVIKAEALPGKEPANHWINEGDISLIPEPRVELNQLKEEKWWATIVQVIWGVKLFFLKGVYMFCHFIDNSPSIVKEELEGCL